MTTALTISPQQLESANANSTQVLQLATMIQATAAVAAVQAISGAASVAAMTVSQKREPTPAQALKFVQTAVHTFKVAEFAGSESPLSSLLGKKANRLDIMILFLKIMLLLLDSREQELLSRKLEREIHIKSMEGVSKNLYDQGNTLLMTGIFAGLFSVLSGVAPMLGYCKAGKSLKDSLGSLMTSANEIEQEPFWKNMGKVLQGISQSSDNGGKIHGAFAQSSQVKQQTKGDISKMDWDDLTRRRESMKKYVEEIENFIRQIFNLDQEVVRALFH